MGNDVRENDAGEREENVLTENEADLSLFSENQTDNHLLNMSHNNEGFCNKSVLDSGYSSLVSPGSSLNPDSVPKPDINSMTGSSSFEHHFSDEESDDDNSCCSKNKKIKYGSYSPFEIRMFQLFPKSPAYKKVLDKSCNKRRKTLKKSISSILISKTSKIFSEKVEHDITKSPNRFKTPIKSSLASLLPLKMYTETIEKSTQLPSDSFSSLQSKDFEGILPEGYASCIENLFRRHDFPEDHDLKDVIGILSPPKKLIIHKKASQSLPSTPFNSTSMCLLSDDDNNNNNNNNNNSKTKHNTCSSRKLINGVSKHYENLRYSLRSCSSFNEDRLDFTHRRKSRQKSKISVNAESSEQENKVNEYDLNADKSFGDDCMGDSNMKESEAKLNIENTQIRFYSSKRLQIKKKLFE